VADGFAALAAEDPRWRVVDGGGTGDEVAARVLRAVTEFFGS
jgi:thymidylate kinase